MKVYLILPMIKVITILIQEAHLYMRDIVTVGLKI
jgi:hypothetical protein